MRYNFLFISFLVLLVSCNCVSATWWDDNYDYRKKIILTGNTSGVQTDYQLLLNVTYDSDMQSDFDDLRFCNETHKLDSWLESKVDGSYALVWVEFPTTPANGVTQDYWMYYGNAGAASDWDIRATMLDGDDFQGSSLDNAIWNNQYCNVAVSGGELTLDNFVSTGGRSGGGLLGKRLLDPSVIFECKIKNTYVSDGAFNGLSNLFQYDSDDAQVVDMVYNNNNRGYQYDNGVVSYTSAEAWTTNTYYRYTIKHYGTGVAYYRDSVEMGGSPLTTNIPDEQLYLRIGGDASYSPTMVVDWVFVHKYATHPPTYTIGNEEYYTPSSTTIANETKLIMSEITTGLKSVNMGNYLVYAFILIGILLIILVIQIISNGIYRG